MAEVFRGERIGAIMWPELVGVGGLCAAHVVARGLDANWALEKPFRRISDWGHVLALLTAGYCVATDRAADTMRAIFYADTGLLASAAGDYLYTRAVGKTAAQVKARKVAEKIAAKKGGGQGAPGGGQLTDAQKQLLLEAAKVVAAGGGQGQGQLVGASVIEF